MFRVVQLHLIEKSLNSGILHFTSALTSPDEVTMEEVGQSSQLRAGELIIIVVVLIMWAGEGKPP